MAIQLIGAPLYNADGFPLAALVEPHHPPFPPHSHAFHELVIVLKGAAVHFWDDEAFRLGPGMFMLIEPGSVHSYEDIEDLGLINVVFQPELIGLGSPYPWVGAGEDAGATSVSVRWQGRLDAASLSRVETLAGELRREIDGREMCYRHAAVTRLREVLLTLARGTCSGRIPHEGGVTDSVRERIRRALRVIIVQHADSLDMAQLAREAGMCERTFRRHFQRVAGMCPAAYLTRVRVRKAALLLQTTDLPVTDVAFAAGFTDLSFFNRSFKGIVAESPRASRARLRHRREMARGIGLG